MLSISVLVMAIGALLAVIGYLLMDAGREQEAALSSTIEHEHSDALLDPLPAPQIDEEEDGGEAEEHLRFSLDYFTPYEYRPLPDPQAGPGPLPGWLARRVREVDSEHTLDRDDQLVVFLRVESPERLSGCPLTWACVVTPDQRGLSIRLQFDRDSDDVEAEVGFVFEVEQDLRHAVGLAQQHVLRIDFITGMTDGRMGYCGSREVRIPPGITGQLRRALRDYSDLEEDQS